MSYQDAIADFIHAMEIEGIKPVEPIAQRLAGAELIRFRCEGDGKGRQNSWAVLYLDEHPAGSFGNFRLGIDRKWSAGTDRRISPEDRRRLSDEWAQAKQRKLEEKHSCEVEAGKDAAEMWGSASPARADHLYLQRKSMNRAFFRQAGDKLLVPMYDHEGRLWNVQRISPDGTKRFLRGGRTDGLFFILGQFSRRGETACIGEGVATMHAVYSATGHPSIVAFSAKNLGAVARIWRTARPDLDLIICADDDSHLDRNIGIEAAKAAAYETGARLAVPLGRAA